MTATANAPPVIPHPSEGGPSGCWISIGPLFGNGNAYAQDLAYSQREASSPHGFRGANTKISRSYALSTFTGGASVPLISSPSEAATNAILAGVYGNPGSQLRPDVPSAGELPALRLEEILNITAIQHRRLRAPR
jgi:hypothetical protein